MSCIVFANLEALRLNPDHLDEALAVFKSKYGAAPAVIGIADHKHNRAIIAEARQRGFTVIHEPGGMLSFEIWMYPEPPAIPKTADTQIATEGRILATTKFGRIPSCQKSSLCDSSSSPSRAFSAQPKTLKGRPKLDVPVAEIRKLGEQGFGAKAIAGQLKAEGYSVSFRTVHRILTGERQ